MSDIDEIQLGLNLKIRELTLEERGNLLEEQSDTPFSRITYPFGVKYIIEYEYQTKKMLGDFSVEQNLNPEVNAQETISKVVAALRLFKSGSIANTSIRTKYKQDFPIAATSFCGSLVENRFLEILIS